MLCARIVKNHLVKSHAPKLNNYFVQKLCISQAWQTALHVGSCAGVCPGLSTLHFSGHLLYDFLKY